MKTNLSKTLSHKILKFSLIVFFVFPLVGLAENPSSMTFTSIDSVANFYREGYAFITGTSKGMRSIAFIPNDETGRDCLNMAQLARFSSKHLSVQGGTGTVSTKCPTGFAATFCLNAQSAPLISCTN